MSGNLAQDTKGASGKAFWKRFLLFGPEQTGTLWATMGHYGRHDVDFRSVSENVQTGSGSEDLASSHRVSVSDFKTSSKSPLSDESRNLKHFGPHFVALHWPVQRAILLTEPYPRWPRCPGI